MARQRLFHAAGVEAVIERDQAGVLHVVALSGGKDSTALAILLAECEPRPYTYVCTPTGDELPEMFEHWRALGDRLGSRILPIMGGTLKSVIAAQGMIPNHRARFCTRIIKIEPYRRWLKEQTALGPVVSYVGLRSDEEGRAGGAYADIDGVSMRFPLREWRMDEAAVLAALEQRNIIIPARTDCARCYHQRIGEWWLLWRDHLDIFLDAEADEERLGHTYRTPGRDTWPTALKDLRAEFEKGRVPTARNDPRIMDLFRSGSCRVCSL
jgi:3'-phosphoadenosine 5'-phosphosulfate sulfotransferase (PAPS reductase)/FAD synthetase